MRRALDGLLNLLPAPDDLNSRLRLVLSVDECQMLTSIKVTNDAGNRTMLDFLAYAIDECRNRGLVGVIPSKSSILTYVPIPKKVPPSAQIIELDFQVRTAPFVRLTFDRWQNDEPSIYESVTTLFDACKIGFLARFGRPL